MTDRYEFIDSQRDAGSKYVYPLTCMCAWLGVSTSGFYDWRKRPASATARRRQELELIIGRVFADSDGTYGYRRLHAYLARAGVRCGPDLVRQLMRQLGLVPCQPRPWRPVTTVAGDASQVPDLVDRDFTADKPGVKMVGDITYIRTWEGWLYLATVIDCYTKEVVGYSMADHMRAELACDALDMAARNHDLVPGAVFHSDRGCQYTSDRFAAKTTELGIRRSMGRTGVCFEVSQRREFHPPLLSEPGVTVSRHRAPTVEPVGIAPCFQ